MAARLLRLGYAPNTLVWDQPPLFVILLSWAMCAGGDSIVTARLAMVGFAIVALLALARLTASMERALCDSVCVGTDRDG